jgi:oxygen-independent coproporphyrinogen-3 oxidase
LESSEVSVSLYVHVPFCEDKCLYCNFYSLPRRSVHVDIQEAVVEQTIRQAQFLTEALGYHAPPPTIFMGGGTPSALQRPLLQRLLSSLGDPGCREWTVEANPESLDAEFLDLCSAAGVSRLSVGVQSTDDRHLRTLKRSASRADVLGAAAFLRDRWQGDVNLDFIAGIPGQEPSDVVADLKLLDELSVPHVSLYSLTYEPDTPLARLAENGGIRPNSPHKDEELWFAGVDELQRRGYCHYEVSNFCRPGKECRHNLRYWRLLPYIGAGPGAVSTLPAEPVARAFGKPELAERGGVLRVSNPRNIQAFLSGRDGLWGAELELISSPDFLLETLMMGLRLEEGISALQFRERFGSPFDEIFPGLWRRWVETGAARPAGARLALSHSGRMILDGLLSEIGEMPDHTRLHVSWP